MNKFPMDLSKFKKIHSDERTTTLQHPHGHEIRISHGSLSTKMRQQLSKLPGMEDSGKAKKSEPVKMADGGLSPAKDDSEKIIDITLPEAGSATPAAPTDFIESPALQALGQGDQASALALTQPMAQPMGMMSDLSGQPSATPPAPMPSAPQLTPTTPEAGMAPSLAQPDPFGAKATEAATLQSLQQQQVGIKGEAAAQAKLGQEQAKIKQQQVANEQALLKDYKGNFDAISQETQQFKKALVDQHIDPQRYMGKMDTSQKLNTAIGLILGGMGGGASGRNPAQEFLEKQIENDIEAQKAEIGKRATLLEANLKLMGNMNDAAKMTHLMMNESAMHQIEQAAAKNMGPAAKAAALKSMGQLQQQNAGIIGQLAMKRTILGGVNAGAVPPERVVEMVIPEASRPEARKELKEVQELHNARNATMAAFDKLAELSTAKNVLLNPIQYHSQRNAILGAVIPPLSKASSGKYTEADSAAIEHMFPLNRDNDESLAIKRAKLEALTKEHIVAPTLKAYGIDPMALGRYNNQGQNVIQESKPEF